MNPETIYASLDFAFLTIGAKLYENSLKFRLSNLILRTVFVTFQVHLILVVIYDTRFAFLLEKVRSISSVLFASLFHLLIIIKSSKIKALINQIFRHLPIRLRLQVRKFCIIKLILILVNLIASISL